MLQAFGKPNDACASAHFQWQAETSEHGVRKWTNIPGAQQPEFFASAAYNQKRLRLELMPIKCVPNPKPQTLNPKP